MKTDISQAKKDIDNAAKDAIRVIASAADEASRVIASAASEALKVTNVRDNSDHDLIIKLDTKMDDLRADIQELKDGTHKRITDLENHKLNIKDSYLTLYKEGVEKSLLDHETRIRTNTERIVRIMTWGSAALLVLGTLEFIINKYL